MEMSEFKNMKPVKEAGKKIGTIITIIIVAVVLLVALGSSFTVINEGYVGVKYQFGKIIESDLTAGLNFKIPFIQDIRSVDIREQMYETQTTAYTKDTQTVENLHVKLTYVYDKSSLENLIRNIGINNIETKLIIPQVQSVMKNEIGKVKAEELVQSRSTIQENIESKLRDDLAKSGIIISSFSIENIDFEDGFEEAIRAKVVAEQEALKMQNKTKEEEELARQAVIKAQAAAESEKIKADAEAYAIEKIQQQLTQSPEYIELKRVEKWDGKYPQVMGESVNPFINMGNAQ